MGILSDRQITAEVKIDPFVVYDKEAQKGKISFGTSGYGYDARIGHKFKVFKPYPALEIDPLNFAPELLEEVDLSPPRHNWQLLGENVKEWTCILCKEECKAWELPVIKQVEKCPANTDTPFIRIPPHSFVLGETVETFTIPRDVLCVVVGKSTYARCGIYVNVTPGEPEWTGKWTVEISNTTPLPARVYCGMGIMQCLFFRSDEQSQAVYRNLKFLVSQLEESVPARDREKITRIYDEIERTYAEGNCGVSYADKKGKYQGQAGLTLPKPGE